MDVQIVSRTNKDFLIQIKIPYCKEMPEFKNIIQAKLNEAEVIAMGEVLEEFERSFSNNYRG